MSNTTTTKGTTIMKTEFAAHTRSRIRTIHEPMPANVTSPPQVSVDSPQPVDDADEPQPPAPGKGHIGRVVTGSIITGLVAAIAVVAGPFAGAKEHVITGSVLITFAIAWAALAFLAERWTDQPQRWAIAPAVFMGVSGTFVLLAAPTGNELGWVWPPVVAMLTIWMIVHARRTLRSRARVWVVYPVFAVLMLSAVGGVYETSLESAEATSFRCPDS